MQRVRIGLTGLACVFLLVLLAAAFFGFAKNEADLNTPITANAASSGGADSAAADAAPKDPLAELGVAPGNDPGDEAANGAAAHP